MSEAPIASSLRPVQVILEDARPGCERAAVYTAPTAILRADDPKDVNGAFAAIEAALKRGRHVAGYFSYELGYLLESRLAPLLPAMRQVPLLWFGVFDHPQTAETAVASSHSASTRAYAGPLMLEWDEAAYRTRFERVHDLIGAGDLYQANLSFRARFAFAGDPLGLYRSLRAKSQAGYCAYVDDGDRNILSLSPELFFDSSPDGTITARPMKGTAARGA